MNRLFGGNQSRAALEEARASNIIHFDHQYSARLIAYAPQTCPEAAPSIADDNSTILPPGRQCKLVLDSSAIKLSETIGESISDMADRDIFRAGYFTLAELAWDHSVSGAKFTVANTGPEAEKPWVVVYVENSLELERDIRLRLKGAARPGARFPAFQYVGMFAGPTKPKPFQRKRPNLTERAQGKLPPLSSMRQWAMQQYRGALKPLASGNKGRSAFALDHIHGGHIEVPIVGRGMSSYSGGPRSGEMLRVGYDGIFVVDASQQRARSFTFADSIQGIQVQDGVQSGPHEVGVELMTLEGPVFFPVAMASVRYVRAAVEFFWNRYRLATGFPAMLCSTHGRKVLKCHTLEGEKDAPEAPVGNLEVVDFDGAIIKAAPEDGAVRRRSLSRSNAAASSKRRSNILGSRRGTSNKPASIRPDILGHWDNVVKHQGWLTKRGGAAKQWLRRYFVLYSTCQGHFLTYYADVRESPLVDGKRMERNTIDLCKVTFIRPVSRQEDAPENAFDIVTIERDWTLGADDNEHMQLWLRMITRAVDEDVSIVPDDEIDFRVKALQDPTRALQRNDYTTALKVGCMGVSVNHVRPGDECNELFFWCYTDFYKWSTIQQGAKLALLLNVFMTTDFDAKQEFIFRTTVAPQLATAIEFYIEKFMSIMHMNREDQAEPAPSPRAKNAASPKLGGAQDADDSQNLLDVDWADSTADAAADAAALAARDSVGSTHNDDLLNFMSQTGNGAPHTSGQSAQFLSDLGLGDPSVPRAANAAPGTAWGAQGSFQDEAAGAMGEARGLSDTAAAELSLLLLKLAVYKEGAVVADRAFPVAMDAKIEYRGSQARVTLSFTNQDLTGSVSGLQARLAGGDPVDALRMNSPSVEPSSIMPRQRAQYVLLCECMKPFSSSPQIRVGFQSSGSPYEVQFPLPIFVTGFVEAVNMPLPDFQARWASMAGAGQAIQAVVTPAGAAASPMTITQLMARGRSFGECSSATANASGVVSQCFAGTLRTGKEAPGEHGEMRKISAGCLVVIETNEAAGVYRLNVRSVHQSVSQALFDDLKVQLESAAAVLL